jgi:hypothetical protein
MKQYYKFDLDRYYMEPVYAASCPDNCTETPLPQPNWLLRLDGEKWIEERPDPQNGMLWNQETKEWDLDPPSPSPDPEARIAQMEAIVNALVGVK